MKKFVKDLIPSLVVNVVWWYVFAFLFVTIPQGWWGFPTLALFIILTILGFAWFGACVQDALKSYEKRLRGY